MCKTSLQFTFVSVEGRTPFYKATVYGKQKEIMIEIDHLLKTF